MMNYVVEQNDKIREWLTQIEVSRRVIETLPGSRRIEIRKIKESLLQSSLFSARIEGNPLSVAELNTHSALVKEVQQLARVYTRILNTKTALSLALIKKLHLEALTGIVPQAGEWRKEQTAIFDMAGNAIYLTPPAKEIEPKLQQLIRDFESKPEHPLIKTFTSHYRFEKIHPFVDGNGRVGRLLMFWMLKQADYHFKGLLNLEEALEAERGNYYDVLNLQARNLTPLVEFFLELLARQAEKVIEALSHPNQDKPEERLLPRRREILALIRDHQEISFDFIHRRFLAVKPSTLHYDLNQLIKQGLVQKVGSTRGALYRK